VFECYRESDDAVEGQFGVVTVSAWVLDEIDGKLSGVVHSELQVALVEFTRV